MTSILGVSGSLRAGSLHTELLRLAAEELEGEAELEVFDSLRSIPPYDADDEGELPDAVREFIEALESADAVVFSSPEYNGSIPGQLKNAIDWVSRKATGLPLRGKPVLVIGGSPGQFGALWGHAELRKVLGIAGAKPAEAELSIPRLDEALSDPPNALRDDLRTALTGLVTVAEAHTGTIRTAADPSVSEGSQGLPAIAQTVTSQASVRTSAITPAARVSPPAPRRAPSQPRMIATSRSRRPISEVA